MEYITNSESGIIEISCPPSETQIHSYEPISNSNFCRGDKSYIEEFTARLGVVGQPIVDVTGSTAFEIASKYISKPNYNKTYRLIHDTKERFGAISDVTMRSANFDYRAQARIMRIRSESDDFRKTAENFGQMQIGEADSISFNAGAEKAKILTRSTALLYATIDILANLKKNKELYYPTEFLKSVNSQINTSNVLSSFGVESNYRNTLILSDIIKNFCFDPDHYDIKKAVTSKLQIKLYETKTVSNVQIHTPITEIHESIEQFALKLRISYISYINQKEEISKI
jgi:hypothetical protein